MKKGSPVTGKPFHWCMYTQLSGQPFID